MKPATAELLALLAGRQFYAADLYTFAGGNLGAEVLRYCGGDTDLTANGYLYPAGGQTGPYFDRQDNKATCHWKFGLNVDQLVFDVLPGSATVLGLPFLQAVDWGAFDGATCLLEKAFMPTYGDTSRGLIRYFYGRVAEIDQGRSIATFTVNSFVELLNNPLPRNLIEPACINNVGDHNCGASVPIVSGTVTSGATASYVPGSLATSSAYAAGTFDLGKLTFTSGALSGFTMGVRAAPLGTLSGGAQPVQITTQGPLPGAPATGDGFALYFGCNKSFTDPNGCPKFGGTPADRFRGAPYVPQPIVAV